MQWPEWEHKGQAWEKAFPNLPAACPLGIENVLLRATLNSKYCNHNPTHFLNDLQGMDNSCQFISVVSLQRLYDYQT